MPENNMFTLSGLTQEALSTPTPTDFEGQAESLQPDTIGSIRNSMEGNELAVMTPAGEYSLVILFVVIACLAVVLLKLAVVLLKKIVYTLHVYLKEHHAPFYKLFIGSIIFFSIIISLYILFFEPYPFYRGLNLLEWDSSDYLHFLKLVLFPSAVILVTRIFYCYFFKKSNP